jgi:hypothetical protein
MSHAEMDTSRNAANPGTSSQCPSDRRHDGGGRSVSSDSEPRRNLLMYDYGIVSDFILWYFCVRARIWAQKNDDYAEASWT